MKPYVKIGLTAALIFAFALLSGFRSQTERKPGTSPWESVGKDSKKEKKEPMRSPWADEGGGK